MQVFDSNEKIGIYYFYPRGVPAGTGALHAGVFYSKVELGRRPTLSRRHQSVEPRRSL